MGARGGAGWVLAALAIAVGACGDEASETCVSGAAICRGETVWICGESGAYFYARECGSGDRCVAGACVPPFEPDAIADTDTNAGDTDTGDTGAVDSDTRDTGAGDSGETDTREVTGDTFEADTGEADTGEADTHETQAPDTEVPDIETRADTEDTAVDTGPDSVDAGPEPEAAPGRLSYARVDNIAVVDDLTRLAWAPDGSFALVAGMGGKLALYVPGERLASLGTIGTQITDLIAIGDIGVACSDGCEFGVVEATKGLVRVRVDGTTKSFETLQTLALSVGSGRAIAREPGAARFGIAAHGSNSIAYLYTWSEADGLSAAKGFNAGGGVSDLMWGAPALYAGSANLITSHGLNGADSKTWVLESPEIVGNGWSPGYGNAGQAAWRPGGGYGLVCGWSSNKLYVFDGSWTMATLPVPTGASPNGVAWKHDGTRALVVGRVIATPPYAVVVEQRAGTDLGWRANFVDQSIPNFNAAPWNGNNSSMHLLDVAWRPGTTCDEGLIVGTDSGSTFSPTFGMAIRFYDQDDPACAP
ncbi:MAG: hypothetical protein JNJ59_15715 [Deltaproteobacteria bacterium]|nr:hypothetical protein [Deltaproteobacteria bacterium]